MPYLIGKDVILKCATAAKAAGLDPAVVCAVVEHESSGNPDAIRFEPQFFRRVRLAHPEISPDEAFLRSVSWGLMQVLGETAVVYGGLLKQKRRYVDLLDPDFNLAVGTKYLKYLLDAKGSIFDALATYNGSVDYAKAVTEISEKYRKYAILSV
jgi:soluble lytic murein transglycosylase-like protein